jgi:hypothetical protein
MGAAVMIVVRLFVGLLWVAVLTAVIAAGTVGATALNWVQRPEELRQPGKAEKVVREIIEKWGVPIAGGSFGVAALLALTGSLPGTRRRPRETPPPRPEGPIVLTPKAAPAAAATPAKPSAVGSGLFDQLGAQMKELAASKGGPPAVTADAPTPREGVGRGSGLDLGRAASGEAEGPTPTSRVYVHRRCGGATVVDGDDFAALCNPFSIAKETYCCTCQGFDELSAFTWEDTGESISQYRQRMKRLVPDGKGPAFGGIMAFLAFFACMAAAVALSFVIPDGRKNLNCALGGLIVGLVAALITYLKFADPGIDFRRMK